MRGFIRKIPTAGRENRTTSMISLLPASFETARASWSFLAVCAAVCCGCDSARVSQSLTPTSFRKAGVDSLRRAGVCVGLTVCRVCRLHLDPQQEMCGAGGMKPAACGLCAQLCFQLAAGTLQQPSRSIAQLDTAKQNPRHPLLRICCCLDRTREPQIECLSRLLCQTGHCASAAASLTVKACAPPPSPPFDREGKDKQWS
mmetsp:Transcript_6870/g.19374  ORF Transcript_6870/g.19374 Transcript_6870/m.19374 type:complete len:201 (-) Transcript_6870:491-1093(-)